MNLVPGPEPSWFNNIVLIFQYPGSNEEKKPMNVDEGKEMSVKLTANPMNGHANSQEIAINKEKDIDDEEEDNKNGCCRVVCTPCIILWTGWKTYARQAVVFAGLALSMLYMTVLGFDGITVGKH